MNDKQTLSGGSDLYLRITAAREAMENHKKSAFHENSPCGGCHFWQGYIGALEDVISGEWHSAMQDRRVEPETPHGMKLSRVEMMDGKPVRCFIENK